MVSTTHTIGTRKRAPPQPKYLVCEIFDILYLHVCTLNITEYHFDKQGNSVAQDFPPTGSEANTTICCIYVLDIDSHCPYLHDLLSGETTFHLTYC